MTAHVKSRIVTVAGAGTGKTHALVERYLHALLGLEAPHIEARGPERLLAITFTEKAAHEMRARLERRLGDLRYAPEREPDVVARAVEMRRVLDDDALENMRRSLSGAPIFTFHAFCARVLRDHALAAGLDPAFVVLEPDDENRLLEETAEACVIDALQRSDPLVAELVARVQLHGFGERKGLVECLVDLHGTLAERGLSSEALPLAPAASTVEAALALVAQAAAAMKKNVAGQGGARLVAIDEARLAIEGIRASAARVDDPEAALSRAWRDLAKHAGGNWGGNKVTNERRALASAVDVLGAALVDEFTRELAPAVRKLLVELDARQRREKHARGFLAFGDLLLGARDLLRMSTAVRARVRERFARIFVDEYQDTSPVQEEILALLHVDSEEGRTFVVGDPKQSIYGFRGADARVFSRALADPASERLELSVSRRSLEPIVDLANLVATHALPRGPHGVDAAMLVPLTSLRMAEVEARAPPPGTGPGAAFATEAAGSVAGAHWLVAPRGAAAEAPALSPHELESLVVAKKLREHIDAGHFSAGDVAILVRRGKASVPLARALARAGIPSVVVGGDGFYQRPEVADIITALTLATDPDDELAVLTVLRSPLVAAPDDAILALYERLPDKRGLTWPRVVENAPRLASQIADLAGLGDRVRAFDAVLDTVRRRLHEEPLGRAVDALLDDARYAAACAVEPDGELRLRNLEKLRHLVTRMGAGAGKSESALVAVARLTAALDDPPPEPLAQALLEANERKAVRIMTVHQAKGLEFPVVVIADAGSGLKGESDDVAFDAGVGLAVTARGRPIAACVPKSSPSSSSRAFAPTAIQAVRRRLRERNEGELARLLYVAVTRARDRLFVVGAPRRSGPGSLLGQLELVRAADPRVDALLPRVDVDATLTVPPTERAHPALAAAHAHAHAHTLEPLPAHASPGRARLRLRASDLGLRARGQETLPFDALGQQGGRSELDDEERLPPRAAGRLSHALLAIVATERREALHGERAQLVRTLERCAFSLGALDVPGELIARCADTLAGPVRALLDAGYTLSFEESLWLEREAVVLEGKADLVARKEGACSVVELKLTAATAKGEGAQLQVAVYAAALEARGEKGITVSTWALGDTSPAPPVTFGKAQRAKLEAALAKVVATT